MARAKEHVDELLKLTLEERSAAAEALLASLEDDAGETNAEDAWLAEIERRVATDSPGVPAEQVFAEGRERLRRDP